MLPRSDPDRWTLRRTNATKENFALFVDTCLRGEQSSCLPSLFSLEGGGCVGKSLQARLQPHKRFCTCSINQHRPSRFRLKCSSLRCISVPFYTAVGAEGRAPACSRLEAHRGCATSLCLAPNPASKN